MLCQRRLCKGDDVWSDSRKNFPDWEGGKWAFQQKMIPHKSIWVIFEELRILICLKYRLQQGIMIKEEEWEINKAQSWSMASWKMREKIIIGKRDQVCEGGFNLGNRG